MASAQYYIKTSTIAISGTNGAAVQLADFYEEVGIILPASLTNASLKLQVSPDEHNVSGGPTNWFDLYEPVFGNLVPNLAASTGNRAVGIDPKNLLGFMWVRPVLSAAQGQGAVNITFIFKKLSV